MRIFILAVNCKYMIENISKFKKKSVILIYNYISLSLLTLHASFSKESSLFFFLLILFFFLVTSFSLTSLWKRYKNSCYFSGKYVYRLGSTHSIPIDETCSLIVQCKFVSSCTTSRVVQLDWKCFRWFVFQSSFVNNIYWK